MFLHAWVEPQRSVCNIIDQISSYYHMLVYCDIYTFWSYTASWKSTEVQLAEVSHSLINLVLMSQYFDSDARY